MHQIGHLAPVQALLKLRNILLRHEKCVGNPKVWYLSSGVVAVWNCEKRAFYRHFYRYVNFSDQASSVNLQQLITIQMKMHITTHNNFSVIFGGNFLCDTPNIKLKEKKNLSKFCINHFFSFEKSSSLARLSSSRHVQFIQKARKTGLGYSTITGL